ncbi:hypothetical protein [Micromonospora mirobrigensis]|uniref:hypothetical protein n=1 Tax=Micromonospora mirobrigensis TaxID=262898 RepID=UPI00114CBE0E|nr:hypothetical protein [Micromonospora mirobrigensis]
MDDWIIEIIFSSTPQALRASKARNDRLPLDWKVVERRNGAALVATQTLRRKTVSSALSKAARTLEWIQRVAEAEIIPLSVSVRPDGTPEQVPELVTLAEIAIQLGVSRQRVQQLSRQAWFPPPVARTKSGPIYTVADAIQLQRVRETKKGNSYGRQTAERSV